MYQIKVLITVTTSVAHFNLRKHMLRFGGKTPANMDRINAFNSSRRHLGYWVLCSHLNRGESLMQSSKSTVILDWIGVFHEVKTRISSPGRIKVEMQVSPQRSCLLLLQQTVARSLAQSCSADPEPLHSVLNPLMPSAAPHKLGF